MKQCHCAYPHMYMAKANAFYNWSFVVRKGGLSGAYGWMGSRLCASFEKHLRDLVVLGRE